MGSDRFVGQKSSWNAQLARKSKKTIACNRIEQTGTQRRRVIDMNYYVLTKLNNPNPSERWTFSTREQALKFLESRLCWGCKRHLRDVVSLEHNPSTNTLESIVTQDALDTDCGAEYRIDIVTQDEYRERANKALEEMTKIFETVKQPVGYAAEEQNENLSQENDKSNRVD